MKSIESKTLMEPLFMKERKSEQLFHLQEFLSSIQSAITEQQNINLLREVTEVEISTALESIRSFKAPCPDGLQPSSRLLQTLLDQGRGRIGTHSEDVFLTLEDLFDS